MNAFDPCAFDTILRNDFASFAQKVFYTVVPGDPLLWNWHHGAIARHLQDVVEGRIRRLVINVPPRSMKSICASVALPAWFLGRDPTRRVICASYADGLAVDLHNKTRSVMAADWYRRAFPHIRIGGKNTDNELKTLQGGGRLATSVGGTLTGRGANLIIIDDPIKPQDAMSEASRNPQIEAGRVCLPDTAPWLHEFEREIMAFPSGRYDDQVDTVSQFLNWYFERDANMPRIRSFDD